MCPCYALLSTTTTMVLGFITFEITNDSVRGYTFSFSTFSICTHVCRPKKVCWWQQSNETINRVHFNQLIYFWKSDRSTIDKISKKLVTFCICDWFQFFFSVQTLLIQWILCFSEDSVFLFKKSTMLWMSYTILFDLHKFSFAHPCMQK